jgi:BlaI family transcriptional regulator, penicillinase repressor
MSTEAHLSRRERQIMDVLHQRGQATAAEVQAAMPDAPGYSAVRALLRILEDKGHVKHCREGARYVYLPRASREAARRAAMKRVVATFFHGSIVQAIAGLLDTGNSGLTDSEVRTLRELIDEARKEGR